MLLKTNRLYYYNINPEKLKDYLLSDPYGTGGKEPKGLRF